jgi:hypothetical protein
MKNNFDKQRIDFIVHRDGLEAAIEFSKRTLKQYKGSLKKRSLMRRNLVMACLSHREFLISNNHYYGAKND